MKDQAMTDAMEQGRCGGGVHAWLRPEGEDRMPPAWPYAWQMCECGAVPFDRKLALTHPDGWGHLSDIEGVQN